MPRKILIFLLILTLGVLITLMGWFSLRMYKTETENARNLERQKHESALRLTIWQLETTALELYNTCIVEITEKPETANFIKSHHLINSNSKWGLSSLPEEPNLPAQETLERSLWADACKDVSQQIPPDNVEKKKEKVAQRYDYSTRSQNAAFQKGVTQQILTNSYEEINKPINSAPYQAGWVGERLYLLRSALGENQIEAVLLDHEKISLKLSARHPHVTLSPNKQPYITLSGEKLQLLPPSDTPFIDNTLVTLPYEVILPLSPSAPPNYLWLRNLAITWAALLLTIILAGLCIISLIRLSQRRSQFVSSVTHELRTPLTSFQLYAEMLRDDLVPSPEKRHHYLDTLNREAKRLSHLVENVLAYSQIERGKLHKSSIPLSELLPPIIERLQSRVDQTSATLKVINPLPPETVIITDPTAVEQILFNLIDNACKYALDEKPTQEIQLEITQDPRHLSFHIKDEGPGIPHKERNRLFLPFHKSAETAANTFKPGVGLGLSIAKRHAKLLKGTLTLDHKRRTGSTFTLRLPA